MRYGVIPSVVLHLAVVALAVFGLPGLFDREPERAMAVEIVVMDERTDPSPTPAASPKSPPPAPPLPAPPPPPPVPEPAPEIPEPAPTEEPEPAPKAPEPKAAEEPRPVPETKAKPKPTPKPAPSAKKQAAPRPRAKPRPPPSRLQSLLKDLARQEAPPSPPPARSPLDETVRAARIVEAVRRQLEGCWSIPAGAKDAADMKVAIRIQLRQDGALSGPPRVRDQGRMERDPSFLAVAESALRALRDPRCMPLKLPFDQYGLWKEITFNFDPREALGQ